MSFLGGNVTEDVLYVREDAHKKYFLVIEPLRRRLKTLNH